MSREEECVFCSIVEGTVPADVVYEGEKVLFFRDIAPKAKVHVVGITRNHLSSLAEVGLSNVVELGELMAVLPEVADQLGVRESGFRVISNVGINGGQEVAHLHVHLLGGERLGPMRC